VSESASSDTTALAGDNITTADTTAANEDGAAAQQSAQEEVKLRYVENKTQLDTGTETQCHYILPRESA